jgi:hypothetical protein
VLPVLRTVWLSSLAALIVQLASSLRWMARSRVRRVPLVACLLYLVLARVRCVWLELSKLLLANRRVIPVLLVLTPTPLAIFCALLAAKVLLNLMLARPSVLSVWLVRPVTSPICSSVLLALLVSSVMWIVLHRVLPVPLERSSRWVDSRRATRVVPATLWVPLDSRFVYHALLVRLPTRLVQVSVAPVPLVRLLAPNVLLNVLSVLPEPSAISRVWSSARTVLPDRSQLWIFPLFAFPVLLVSSSLRPKNLHVFHAALASSSVPLVSKCAISVWPVHSPMWLALRVVLCAWKVVPRQHWPPPNVMSVLLVRLTMLLVSLAVLIVRVVSSRMLTQLECAQPVLLVLLRRWAVGLFVRFVFLAGSIPMLVSRVVLIVRRVASPTLRVHWVASRVQLVATLLVFRTLFVYCVLKVTSTPVLVNHNVRLALLVASVMSTAHWFASIVVLVRSRIRSVRMSANRVDLVLRLLVLARPFVRDVMLTITRIWPDNRVVPSVRLAVINLLLVLSNVSIVWLVISMMFPVLFASLVRLVALQRSTALLRVWIVPSASFRIRLVSLRVMLALLVDSITPVVKLPVRVALLASLATPLLQPVAHHVQPVRHSRKAARLSVSIVWPVLSVQLLSWLSVLPAALVHTLMWMPRLHVFRAQLGMSKPAPAPPFVLLAVLVLLPLPLV